MKIKVILLFLFLPILVVSQTTLQYQNPVKQRLFVLTDIMNEPDDQNLGRLLALYDLGRAETFEKDFARFRDLNQSNPEGIARVYAWTGNSDEAFRWLDIMVEEQGREWVADVKTDLYSKIKSDPRWQAFLERNGQADEQMEAIVFNPVLPPEIQQLLKEEK